MILSIAEILEEKARRQQAFKKQYLQVHWEKTKEFCTYCNLPIDDGTIKYVMKLKKQFGSENVESLRSYLRDARFNPYKVKGLLYSLLQKQKEKAEKKLLPMFVG